MNTPYERKEAGVEEDEQEEKSHLIIYQDK